ncbi:MAG: hypothetical protein JJ897_12355 [Marinibacterium sp.]|nr:hypothetical protein [Marinibacterium sp.]
MSRSPTQSVTIERQDDGNYTLTVDGQEISNEIDSSVEAGGLYALFDAAIKVYQDHQVTNANKMSVGIHAEDGAVRIGAPDFLDALGELELTDAQLRVLRQLSEPDPIFLWDTEAEAAVYSLVLDELAYIGHGHGNRPVITDAGREALRLAGTMTENKGYSLPDEQPLREISNRLAVTRPDLAEFVFKSLLPDDFTYEPENPEHAKIGSLFSELLDLELRIHHYALNCNGPTGPDDVIDFLFDELARTRKRAPKHQA